MSLIDKAMCVEVIDAPGLHLHPLKGDRNGLWALTVQAYRRVVFRFEAGDAYVVDYPDYHQRRRVMRMNNPPHPGEILLELWLTPLNLTIKDAAAQSKVTRKTVSEPVNGKSGVSAEMALRLELAFGKSAESWLAHQAAYDLRRLENRRETLSVHRVAA
ncbi:HigA family addiction module antidote protein [Candidatus Methylospira mobilis]|uniref:HigA family addiction module antidote protein n=1 Tax=Candidatus Methylospira mobilis TaxID=1808979 RepID=A0A5Q0BGT0_9GAMM|nr:HigA family addiction module antitoxin [Candidatus Methylospira mobilis]QFY41328.1 HigA family addiction module antidote protein [Candidatus Methylospira mobilis]WNV05446.1 HigA family addiction module antitoxin [Candidatus Methylospira mobilis]